MFKQHITEQSPMPADNNFLGRGWQFPPAFSDQGAAVSMVSDEQAVRQSLQILLQTGKGQRLVRSDFHCDLQPFMFRNINYDLLCRVKDTITQAILRYEARVGLEQVLVEQCQQHASALNISINYCIRGTNSRQNMVFPFYLNEGTNINLPTSLSEQTLEPEYGR